MSKWLSAILALFLAGTVSATEIDDHYAALGVSPSATARQIDRAYWLLRFRYNAFRSLASRSALRRRSEIETAYGWLADPRTRQKYDELRKIGAGSSVTGSTGPLVSISVTDGTKRGKLRIDLSFDSVIEMQAASLAAEVIGSAEALKLTNYSLIRNEHQLAALREIAERTNTVSDDLVGAAAQVDMPVRLAALRARLNKSMLNRDELIRFVTESCRFDM